MSLSRLATLLCAFALPSSAFAHELPKGNKLVWTSAQADALPVVLTNRGLLFPEGDTNSAKYRLRCNEAYGATVTEVPGIAYHPDAATFLLVTSETASRTGDLGCTYQKTYERTDVEDVLGSLTARASEPPELLLSTVDPTRLSKVLVSHDVGQTWSVRFNNAPDELFTELLVAPSDAQRIYAVGFQLERNQQQSFVRPLWARSSDGGVTWQQEVLEQDRYLVAVHPTQPDVVFARTWVDPQHTINQLLRSTDGGLTFEPVMQVPGVLSMEAEEGALWLGSSYEGGLFRSEDDGQTFAQVHEELLEVDCVVRRGDALWLCANNDGVDGIWKLRDGSEVVEAVLTFDQVREPVDCGDLVKSDVCRVPWLDWQIELLGPEMPDGPDAGMADAGTEMDTDDASSAEEDAGSSPGARAQAAGCGCALIGASDRQASPLWLAWAALCAALIRRKLRA